MSNTINLGEKRKVIATVKSTAENFQRYVVDQDLTAIEYVVKQGIGKENLINAYNNKDEINNFIGGIELTEDESLLLVPKTFENSSKYTVDENGDEIRWQKNWREYCGRKGDILSKTVNRKYLLYFRITNDNGNYRKLTSEQFYKFSDHFGIENVLTKSEAKALLVNTELKAIRSEYPKEVIENNFIISELNDIISSIESRTGLNIVIPSGSNKQYRIDKILSVIGYN